MARPRRGDEGNKKNKLWTQRICWLIKFQSGLTNQKIEELFGFGALQPKRATDARTGKTFSRYLNGERGMTIDQLQSVAKKAAKQKWWILDIDPTTGLIAHGMFGDMNVTKMDIAKIKKKAADENRLLPTDQECQTMLGPLTPMFGNPTSDRLSDIFKKALEEKQIFEQAKQELLNAIEKFLACSTDLKYTFAGRSIDEGGRSRFEEIYEDNLLEATADRIQEYRIHFERDVMHFLAQFWHS